MWVVQDTTNTKNPTVQVVMSKGVADRAAEKLNAQGKPNGISGSTPGLNEAQQIDWNAKAEYAKTLTLNQLAYAIKDCFEAGRALGPGAQFGKDQGYYHDEISVYRAEIARRKKLNVTEARERISASEVVRRIRSYYEPYIFHREAGSPVKKMAVTTRKLKEVMRGTLPQDQRKYVGIIDQLGLKVDWSDDPKLDYGRGLQCVRDLDDDDKAWMSRRSSLRNEAKADLFWPKCVCGSTDPICDNFTKNQFAEYKGLCDWCGHKKACHTIKEGTDFPGLGLASGIASGISQAKDMVKSTLKNKFGYVSNADKQKEADSAKRFADGVARDKANREKQSAKVASHGGPEGYKQHLAILNKARTARFNANGGKYDWEVKAAAKRSNAAGIKESTAWRDYDEGTEECPDCNGLGVIMVGTGHHREEFNCDTCNNTGAVPIAVHKYVPGKRSSGCEVCGLASVSKVHR